VTIRWGVSPIAWANDDMPELGRDTTLASLLSDVKAIGFDGVELGNKFPRDPDILGPIMAEYGLAIVGGWYSTNLLDHSAATEIAALAAHLRRLKAMGSDVFIAAETSNAVHSNPASRLDRHPVLNNDQWKVFGERLNQVADHVTSHGFRFAYHHHLGTVAETAAELDLLLRLTNDNVGLTLDTGHALYGGIDPVEIVRSHPGRIAHVHCKDVRRARHQAHTESGDSFLGGVLGGMFTVPGDGDYDFGPFMAELARIDYCGWIVVEAEQDPAIANPLQYQKLGLETLQRLARDVELCA
jgi:inosose dehydratase